MKNRVDQIQCVLERARVRVVRDKKKIKMGSNAMLKNRGGDDIIREM
jgi:hypothetical protein